MFLCQRYTGEKLKDIGAYFGVGESSVSQACRRVKDKIRKDKKLERKNLKDCKKDKSVKNEDLTPMSSCLPWPLDSASAGTLSLTRPLSGQEHSKVRTRNNQMESERRPETKGQDGPTGIHATWPKVAIILLNWNNYAASSRCLTSLKKITYPYYTIYLADNHSQDGSGKKLFKQFRDAGVRFIFNEANLGFAAGCNRGIKRALQDGADYILLLNNDCIVYDKNFLNYGVALAESDPYVGIVGGKILFWPDTKRIWSTGGYIRFWSAERHIGHGEIDEGQYDEVSERRFISGALMLVKREVFDRIGLLPEVYFFGKEEWEFSNRARRAGFRLLYHPKFSVYHEASSSHEWIDPTYVYNGTLSKILYKRRNLSRGLFKFWFLVYKAYLNFFFPLKYRLQRKRYLQGVPPNVLHRAMMDAVRDAPRTERVTEEMLAIYRCQHRVESDD